MKSALLPTLLLAPWLAAACKGTEPPIEVLPRIVSGDCVSIALQTSAGDERNVLVIESLRARISGSAGCGKLSRLEIGGWMDVNRNGRVDPGEALRSGTHLAPGAGSDEMTLSGIGLELPEGNLKDLKLTLSVYFTSGRTTHIEVAARE